jgi:hypothetical protein
VIDYANAGGDSGVARYELGEDYIDVEFTTGAVYRYSVRSAGKANVEKLKKFALAGIGLNSYIARVCKKLYEPRAPF